MDVEMYEAAQAGPSNTSSSSTSQTKARALSPVIVPADSPFELDSYAALYKSRAKVQRLMYIARSSPSLALDAYTLAATELKASTLDSKTYLDAVSEHNAKLLEFERELSGSSSPSAAALASAGRSRLTSDSTWLNETKRKVASTQDKLDVELKTYQNNLIKESIRMGHRDIGAHLHASGDVTSATRAYTKSRDFCATASHVLEMCLSIIELALESYNYALLRNYTLKAESALDTAYPLGNAASGAAGAPSALGAAAGNAAAASKAAGASGAPAGGPPAKKDEARDRQRAAIQDQLNVATGVAELAQGSYGKAARAFLRISAASARSEENSNLIHPADLVLYAVLCGLAAFTRPELKRLVIDNAEIRPMLELEPHLREVLSAFRESRYKDALATLERHQARYLLDVHLSHQVGNLMGLIRSRAIIQYLEPFETARIARMAEAFGFSDERMEQDVVALIGAGDLKARIDSRDKVIKAHAPSQRNALFKNAYEVGEFIDRSTRAMQFRTKLIAHDVIVKPPKGHKSGGDGQQPLQLNGNE